MNGENRSLCWFIVVIVIVALGAIIITREQRFQQDMTEKGFCPSCLRPLEHGGEAVD